MEKRSQALEEKVEKLKRFQKMIKSASTLQCKFCCRILSSEVFGTHLAVCTKDKGVNSLRNFYQKLPIQIELSQTLIKEESNLRSYTVFYIVILGICTSN